MTYKRSDRLTNALKAKQPFVFLSSLLYEYDRDSKLVSELKTIREKIAANNQYPSADMLPVYVDEVYHDMKDYPDENHLASVLRFNNLIRESEFVIFLLAKTERVGSNVHLQTTGFDHPSPVGFWEFEIFTVAVSQKKFFLIAEEGFSTDDELSQVLTIFRNLLPEKIRLYPKNGFADVVAEILKTKEYPEVKEGNLLTVDHYVKLINFHRFQPAHLKGALEPNLLSPISKDHQLPPDKELITEILNEGHSSVTDFEQRLVKLYMVYRSLLRANYFEKRFSDYLEYWHYFIDQWHSCSRFVGLHGRMSLSGLPMLHDALEIRPRLKEFDKRFKQLDEEHYTHVQLAGTYYSAYSLSRQTIDKELAWRVMTTSGTSMSFANTKGNLYLADGKYAKAAEEFEAWLSFLKGKKDTGEGVFLGESMLKLAYVKLGKLEYLKDLEQLSKEEISDKGARAQLFFRIAQAYDGTDPAAAAEWLVKAETLAKEVKAWDQFNKIQNYKVRNER